MATVYIRRMQETIFRKNEGMILVCQNNADRSLLILGMNPRARELTGYSAEEIKGRGLHEVVAWDIQRILDDHIDFAPDGRDLAAALDEVGEFRLRDKKGKIVRVAVRVALAEARDEALWFRLILRDEEYEREVESFRKLLGENFRAHEVQDEEIRVLSRSSLVRDVEITHHYSQEKKFPSCFALFRLDNFEEIASNGKRNHAVRALSLLAESLKKNLRVDDVVGRMNETTLGVILLDCKRDALRTILGRLRSGVAALPPTSVSFSRIGSQEPSSLIAACEEALAHEPGSDLLKEI